MGLFGNLFEKKICSVCGGEIGLLGNRKLEDGNLCKNCAKKLSPWFSDRRHSTVYEIKEQLAYREVNLEQVKAFHTTRTLGADTKILLDEDAEKFMVTSARNLVEANPDVLNFSDVTGCRTEIDESRSEIKRTDSEGNEVSYNPPRYEYSYDFDIIINVNNPYFDEIKFRLNPSSIEISDSNNARPSFGGVTLNAGKPNPENCPEYRHYKDMSEEIKAVLLNVRQTVRENVAAAAAPKMAVTCPYCGATTTPDEKGCCEFCGGAING